MDFSRLINLSIERELGPLLDISMTNEELGWKGEGVGWTSETEVHYTHLYYLTDYELITHIKGAATIRKYNEKCRVDLAREYNYIERYLNCN